MRETGVGRGGRILRVRDVGDPDGEQLQDQRYASAFAETMREALRQGTSGAGWDKSPGSGDGTST